MEKAKEILRLSLQMGLSQREVASGTGCSLGMVNTVLTRVKDSGVGDPLTLDTKELGSIIYPAEKGKGKAEPDFSYIDKEMKKKGVTLFLLWEEYKLEQPSGYMYTQFCTKYREYRKKNSVYMRKVYKAAERMLVDWAGLTMKYHEIIPRPLMPKAHERKDGPCLCGSPSGKLHPLRAAVCGHENGKLDRRPCERV